MCLSSKKIKTSGCSQADVFTSSRRFSIRFERINVFQWWICDINWVTRHIFLYPALKSFTIDEAVELGQNWELRHTNGLWRKFEPKTNIVSIEKMLSKIEGKRKHEKMLKTLIFRRHYQARVSLSSKSSIFASTAEHLTNFLI